MRVCVRLLSSRRLVHFLVDLVDGQVDVVLDAVQDVSEVRLLVYFELQKNNKQSQ